MNREYMQKPEYKAKMSDSLKRHWKDHPRSPEYCKKLSVALLKYNADHPVHYLVGHKRSEEFKKKLSRAFSGRKRPELVPSKIGKNNPMWKGDAARSVSGYSRANRKFTPSPNMEIHHIDGNPLNNDPRNILFVTRSEHMHLDGRVKNLRCSAVTYK